MSAKSTFNNGYLVVKSCSKAVLAVCLGMVKVHAFWMVGFCGCLVLIGWCIT